MKGNLEGFPLGHPFFLPKGRMSLQTEMATKILLGFVIKMVSYNDMRTQISSIMLLRYDIQMGFQNI